VSRCSQWSFGCSIARLIDYVIEFHGLDPEILQKALQVLVKRGKAQIFGQEDQQGVKFF
jgi:threonine dehydrogenase-like Zn-dependent dehydrogenase